MSASEEEALVPFLDSQKGPANQPNNLFACSEDGTH